MPTDTFFDYQCAQCDAAFCERIMLMNLALDIEDEQLCLNCLAQQENLAAQGFYEWILKYIFARDCFKTPWGKVDVTPCPRIKDKSCFCTAP